MRRTSSWVLSLLLLLLAGAANAAPKEFYYGVYLKDAKLGHFILKQDEETRGGVKTTRSDSLLTLDFRMLGAAARVVTSTILWSDPEGAPRELEYRSESAGRKTGVTASFSATEVRYRADLMGTEKSGTLTLKPGERFLPDSGNGAPLLPKPGERLVGKVFSPETLTLLDAETTMAGTEAVSIGGQSVPAFRVVDRNSLTTSTMWLTETGELLRLDTVMGLQVRRETREQALAEPGQKVDLVAAIGITATGIALENPRRLQRGVYEVRGLTKPFPVSTGTRQSGTYTPDTDGGQVGMITVTAEPLPASTDARLFSPANPAPPAMQPFLKSTDYVPATSPVFRQLAAEILGGVEDPAIAARLIADWVHHRMTPDPTIAALRTADDILRTPRGVCRDYTTLFTTIARAGGLPTRQCVGVAYVDGRFLYHAWPEVWVGSDRWIALEPTWGAPFADATHIKMAEGEITDLFQLAQDMGNYKIRNVEAK